MSHRFIDSHAHVTSDATFPIAEELLERARLAGVDAIINICTDESSLERGLLLANKYPRFYLSGATTPHDVDKEGENNFPLFAEAARSGKLKAVGETGLDYHYEHSARATQKKYLSKYLQLAQETHLPVVIHCREAFRDLFEILDAEYEKQGILHCFTGTMEEAKQVVKRNWFLSLSGIVTFKKSAELHEVAKWVPLTHLLIETDTPYLAPQSKRGKQNEPSYLPETAQFIAHVKGITVAEVAEATTENASKIFKL